MTVVFVSAMATACIGDPDASTSTQGVLDDNRIVTNRIVTNHLELNRIVTNSLVSNRLSNDSYRIVTNSLLTTAEGRELLTYVVSCAIPAGISLVGEYDGVSYVFPGDIGLAPKWLSRALGEPEQRWVSACLIARVNRFGIPVSLSLRGPHKALKVSEVEANDYSLEEGAFYGNVFTAPDQPILWYACRGRDEVANESGDLDLRDCAEPDPENPGFTLCGFTYVGDCADWAPPTNDYGCRNFKDPVEQPPARDPADLSNQDYQGGFYEQCFDAPGNGSWEGAERFPEVVTIFVAPE